MWFPRVLSVALCCWLVTAQAQSPAVVPAPPPASTASADPLHHRPRIALVLSGGGARGFAHIGVLRVLQELRVPVDIVVGTSMGSVVGGAYAAGSSVAQLEQLVRRTDWNSVVADRPPRDELNFRRRQEDLLLPSRIEFGATMEGISLPPAAAGNEALELALTRVLPQGTRDRPVNQLPLPFRSVASDLVTGELVELDDTPLFLAMRASLAVPGVFAPVRVKERLVVDGGLVRNLPVDVARAMGADVIIAVNVGTPLAPEKDLSSAIRVAQQMLQILTEQNVQRSLKELGPRDILLAPNLNGISFLDFARHDRAIQAGEKAARALAAQLVQLAMPEAEYTAFEQHRLAGPVVADQPLPISKLAVEPSGHINPKALEVQSGLALGQVVTAEQAQQAGAQLFGRGDLARVETEVRDVNGGREVLIKPTEADWARSRLRVGLELASDFSDNNTFALKMMHVRSSLNDWGAELRSSARIGTERAFEVEFWQPLGPGSQWYVAPSARYGAAASDTFSLTGQRQNRIGYNYAGTSVVLGRQLGDWGDVHLGVARQSANVRVTIPEDVTMPPARVHQTVQTLAYSVDTLDSVAFPTRGGLFNINLERSVVSAATRLSLMQQSVEGLRAFHSGNWAGHLYAEWARSQQGLAPLNLGGFLRLSGTAPESVAGNRVVLGRVVMARTVGAMPAALGGDVRLGFSLEAGAGYGDGSPLHWSSVKQAGSIFTAVDTRFGPLYFGAGSTKGNSGTLYLFLGPVW
ncbi:patatin-like phospholipase family protein [Rugamonas apoptosis]|uniref:Patatin-like phospholipase family protein n=1 Tax=Rugamonas apoptosis TaxID=2758570 RepID=A0A7W2F636_9BURK|nr:patatin-like phospholipase family protein [Rugamonas apoptosis]MBA5685694.1 patatin-like phospholipase family protein [Rugamonas apoptosis]